MSEDTFQHPPPQQRKFIDFFLLFVSFQNQSKRPERIFLLSTQSLPGVGGVDPREFEDLELSRLSMLVAEVLLLLWRAYSLEVDLADCWVCCKRMLSSLAGLGINPTSQPSLTSRPIHQSLLNFCKHKRLTSDRPRIVTNCLSDDKLIIFDASFRLFFAPSVARV